MQKGEFLANRLALVTGGSKGIGKVITRRLLELGARVAISGRNAADLAAAADEFGDFAARLSTVAGDVSVVADVKRMFAAVDALGALDILVNNAGIAVTKPFLDIEPEEYDRVMAINARGSFLCAQEAMRRMAGRGGRIVNICSASGLRGFATEAAYAASKHAMMGQIKVMAVEGHADGIVVQTICSNGVATEMVRSVRPDLDFDGMIQPDEVADGVEFLLGQNGGAYTDVLTLRRRGNIPYPC